MNTERELLKGNTPLLILSVLKDGKLHGYAIAREIERRTENALQFREGTLYPALHSLEREGLIAGEWQQSEGTRERKVYSLTPAGATELEQRTQTWRNFTSAILKVIGETNHEPQPQSA